jgi:MFS family permease
LSAVQRTSTTSSELGASKWGAFGHAAFAVIWIASIVSYVGTAMFDTASGWLMTSLSADPLAVSLVQVAVSLPLFLFTLPAGALADVIDSRRLLILVESLIVAVFAALVSFGLATTGALLVATFLLGIGGALSSPAWQALTPLLVPRRDLDSAISANSVGYSLSRAVGPALGGIVIAALGISVPFWVFWASKTIPPQAAGMSRYSAAEEITSICADFLADQRGFEPTNLSLIEGSFGTRSAPTSASAPPTPLSI